MRRRGGEKEMEEMEERRRGGEKVLSETPLVQIM